MEATIVLNSLNVDIDLEYISKVGSVLDCKIGITKQFDGNMKKSRNVFTNYIYIDFRYFPDYSTFLKELRSNRYFISYEEYSSLFRTRFQIPDEYIEDTEDSDAGGQPQ